MARKTSVILLLLLCALSLAADAAPRVDTSTGNAVARATCTLASNGSAGFQAWSVAVYSGGPQGSCSSGPSEAATACVELLTGLQSTGMVISSAVGGAVVGNDGVAVAFTTYTLTGSADAGAALIDAAVAAGACEQPTPP